MQPEVERLEPRFKEILYGAMESIRATKAALYLLDGDSGFSLLTGYGFSPALRKTLPPTHPLPDRLLLRRSPFVVNNVADEPRFSETLLETGTERLLAYPVHVHGRLVAVIDLRDKASKEPFAPDDVTKAKKLAEQILAVFAEHQLYGQESLQIAGGEARGERPAPQVARTVELARSAVARHLADAHLRTRTLSSSEMGAIASLLPPILLVPGAVLAAFSSFGSLGGGQIVVSRNPLPETVADAFREKVAAWMQNRREPADLSRIAVDYPLGTDGPELTPERIQNVLSASVRAAGIPHLVLSIAFEAPPDAAARKLLEIFLRQLHQGVDHLVSYSDRRAMNQRIAEKLLEPDFQKFPQLVQHSKRVSSMAEELANAVGLPPPEVELVRLAGLVHDVGMRLLNYETLYRKPEITDTEMRLIQEHPAVSAAMILDSGLPSEVAEIVLAHHERVDGKGYPRALTREQIPPGARILAICEAFDAMTAPDSYQKPLPESEAVQRIVGHAGAQFDAGFAQKFQQMLTRV
ncbi:MAG: GAF and HD-GYP domain-containing protein [Thermoanaerobaculia bacterium]